MLLSTVLQAQVTLLPASPSPSPGGDSDPSASPLSGTENAIEKQSLFCLLHLPTYLVHKSQIITLETNTMVIVTFTIREFQDVY